MGTTASSREFCVPSSPPLLHLEKKNAMPAESRNFESRNFAFLFNSRQGKGGRRELVRTLLEPLHPSTNACQTLLGVGFPFV
jgi:hypothetical protein